MKLLNIKNLSAYNREVFFQDNGYTNIRIPGIVCMQDGTLLCCGEYRRGGDWSAIDIGLQRSTDCGETWSPTRILVSGKGRNTMNNPVLIADGNTVWLLFCENYKRLFITKSEDAGETFGAPKELTDEIETLTVRFSWSVLAVGPGHGIALADHSLVIPVWFGQNQNDIFAHHPSVITVLKIDMNGGKYMLSDFIGKGLLNDPSECCIAQKPDGTLILNIRNENIKHCRAVSFSSDGGISWSAPYFDERLPDPVCCAGICVCGEDLLFSNCASKIARKKLTVKRIGSGGEICEKLPISETGGYSDICFDRNSGKVFVAFENGTCMLHIATVQIKKASVLGGAN